MGIIFPKYFYFYILYNWEKLDDDLTQTCGPGPNNPLQQQQSVRGRRTLMGLSWHHTCGCFPLPQLPAHFSARLQRGNISAGETWSSWPDIKTEGDWKQRRQRNLPQNFKDCKTDAISFVVAIHYNCVNISVFIFQNCGPPEFTKNFNFLTQRFFSKRPVFGTLNRFF